MQRSQHSRRDLWWRWQRARVAAGGARGHALRRRQGGQRLHGQGLQPAVGVRRGAGVTVAQSGQQAIKHRVCSCGGRGGVRGSWCCRAPVWGWGRRGLRKGGEEAGGKARAQPVIF